MRSRSVVVVALLGALLAFPASARAGYLALVPDASPGGAWIAAVDTDTNTRTGYFQAGGQQLSSVAFAPDGRTAYVVATGSRALIAVDMTKSPPASPGRPWR